MPSLAELKAAHAARKAAEAQIQTRMEILRVRSDIETKFTDQEVLDGKADTYLAKMMKAKEQKVEADKEAMRKFSPASSVVSDASSQPFGFTPYQVANFVFRTTPRVLNSSEWRLVCMVWKHNPAHIELSGIHTSVNDSTPHISIFVGGPFDHKVVYHLYAISQGGKWFYTHVQTIDFLARTPRTIAAWM